MDPGAEMSLCTTKVARDLGLPTLARNILQVNMVRGEQSAVSTTHHMKVKLFNGAQDHILELQTLKVCGGVTLPPPAELQQLVLN